MMTWKGGIISMFFHVLKEICASVALLPIHRSLLLLLLLPLICWISSLNAAVVLCASCCTDSEVNSQYVFMSTHLRHCHQSHQSLAWNCLISGFNDLADTALQSLLYLSRKQVALQEGKYAAFCDVNPSRFILEICLLKSKKQKKKNANVMTSPGLKELLSFKQLLV